MKQLLRATALTVLAAGAFVLSATSAGATHSWANYHWPRPSNPFTVKLGDNLSASWDSYLVTASSDWSVSNVLDTTIVAGSTNGRRCKPTSGRVEVCNAAYGNNGWLGLAQIWINGDHITQGLVKVNDSYFALAQYNNKNEKQHVMCQEVGHTFGLGHQDESGISLNTCMDYYHNTSDADTLSIHPNQHDYDQLVTIYTSHFDSASAAKSNSNGNGAPAWSASDDEVELPPGLGPEHGRVFVHDFGGGKRVVTFVVWAD